VYAKNSNIEQAVSNLPQITGEETKIVAGQNQKKSGEDCARLVSKENKSNHADDQS